MSTILMDPDSNVSQSVYKKVFVHTVKHAKVLYTLEHNKLQNKKITSNHF